MMTIDPTIVLTFVFGGAGYAVFLFSRWQERKWAREAEAWRKVHAPKP